MHSVLPSPLSCSVSLSPFHFPCVFIPVSFLFRPSGARSWQSLYVGPFRNLRVSAHVYLPGSQQLCRTTSQARPALQTGTNTSPSLRRSPYRLFSVRTCFCLLLIWLYVEQKPRMERNVLIGRSVVGATRGCSGLCEWHWEYRRVSQDSQGQTALLP